MMIWKLTKMLTPDTVVTIIDNDTSKVLKQTTAGALTNERIEDEIIDWDFSEDHDIYI